jgi:drug/metabolite transporter (DMT)-like permease
MPVNRTYALTFVAMIAFAANSLLCRAALGTGEIDAASFTGIRLISGALVLAVIVYTKSQKADLKPRRLMPALMLFSYATTFSFAYNSLNAATGALVLFGSVQATMMVYAYFSGERPVLIRKIGYLMALGGLIYLMLPGVSAPSLTGSLLMSIAGVSWGIYTLLGRRVSDSLNDTASNFIKTVPFALVLGFFGSTSISAYGMVLACVSGALTSGLGYAIWYSAIRGLTPTQAASVQLSVPVITAIGGVLLLSEEMSVRLLIASLLILGGIGFTLVRTR